MKAVARCGRCEKNAVLQTAGWDGGSESGQGTTQANAEVKGRRGGAWHAWLETRTCLTGGPSCPTRGLEPFWSPAPPEPRSALSTLHTLPLCPRGLEPFWSPFGALRMLLQPRAMPRELYPERQRCGQSTEWKGSADPLPRRPSIGWRPTL